MEYIIEAIRTYLAGEFPGSATERPPEAQEDRKTKSEFDYIATKFLIAGGQHVLYVSDVLLDDSSVGEIDSLLRRLDVAKELRRVGKQPLLVTTQGLLLMLEWVGPHELTDKDILRHAPDEGGIYLLVEPLEAGRWKPFFVDRHERLCDHLQLFASTKGLGRVRCFFCAILDSGIPDAEVVRDRAVKFIAQTCEIEDPAEPELPPLAVNLPRELETP